MQKSRLTKRAMLLAIVAFLFVNLSVMANFQHPDSTDCNTKGYVWEKYDSGSCRYLIQLEGGDLLVPVQIASDFELRDSMRIVFSYMKLDSLTSCNLGVPVYITCIREVIDSVTCWADIEYYPIKCDSLYPGKPCYQNNFQFIGYAPDNTKEWAWYVNDKKVGETDSLTYHFPSYGEFNVCLKIRTEDGCTASICEVLKFDSIKPCEAAFEWYRVDSLSTSVIKPNDTLHNGMTYRFVDYSVGGAVNWIWRINGNIFSQAKNPVYTFYRPGEYKICLTIKTTSGCESTTCHKLVIEGPDKCEAKFEYCTYTMPGFDSIQGDSSNGDKKLIVGFKDVSKPEVHSSYWEFGDGQTSTERNPVHVYTAAGSYKVRLTISTKDNCTDVYSSRVLVGIKDCDVDFTYEMAVPDCKDFKVAYVFKPVFEVESPYISWNFGDGNFSSEREPIHIYEKYGTYEVCLSVEYDSLCGFVRKCHKINVTKDTLDSVIRLKCGTSAITSLKQDESMSISNVYPLPASDKLTISINSDRLQSVAVELFDVSGRKYNIHNNFELVNGKNSIEINLGGFKTGTYIYTISSNDKILRGSISIVK